MKKEIEQAFSLVKSKLIEMGDSEALDKFDDIRLAFVKMDRAYYGLKQTNINLMEKLEKRYEHI